MNYKNGILKNSIEKDIEIKPNDTVYTQITKKKYDKNQRVTEIVWNTIDNKTGKYKFIRSENGLVKETKYNNSSEPEISDFKYEFDKNGSWITKREYKADTLNSIRKRIIEYQQLRLIKNIVNASYLLTSKVVLYLQRPQNFSNFAFS